MIPEVIVYSTLFPSLNRPVHGLFVAELVKALSARLHLTVIAPVLALKNMKEIWQGQLRYCYSDSVDVKAPICFNFPKVLKSTDGYLMAIGSQQAFKESVNASTRLVHAHFAYLDAVAAGILASKMGLPLVVTVHGSDIKILAQFSSRRSQIANMLQGASAIVAVANDLAEEIIRLGIPAKKIHHIPNGVDITRFRPGDKFAARKELGFAPNRRLLLGVGHLVPVKAYDRLIEALAYVDPDIDLALVGHGSQFSALVRVARNLHLEHRVKFVGMVTHQNLSTYYQAADFLVISSHSEGWPTVIFEALACGLPVIAHGVGGIPEVISSPDFGLIMNNNDNRTIAKAISSAYERVWNRCVAVNYASQHSWNEIADQYLRIYKESFK